jgi:hypothetical protein
MDAIRPDRIASSPRRRHDGRVQRVSVDFSLLRRIDLLAVDEQDARRVVVAVCAAWGVPEPVLRFHARRSPFTAACEPPATSSDAPVKGRGAAPGTGARSRYEHGALRLGRTVTLMTLAHELGHHAVHHLDAASTPAHGNVWIGRFDEAAAVIEAMLPS